MSSVYSGITTAGDVVALPEAMREVYSLDILHRAQGVMRYEAFVVVKEELNAEKGQVVRFTTYNDITRGGKLTENVPISTQDMDADQTLVTVYEFGNGIGVTEKLTQLSWQPILQEKALLLGRDYALVRDLDIRDTVAAGGTTTLLATEDAATIADILEEDRFDVELIRQATEILKTANAPKFNEDYYVCFVHPHQTTDLKRDPDWIAADNYQQGRKVFVGEAGRWEDCIFVETTHQHNGAVAATDPGYYASYVDAGAAAQNLYKASFWADQAVGLADALFVEMRDNGVVDFGRKHELAWYAIWGTGVLEDDFIVHAITS